MRYLLVFLAVLGLVLNSFPGFAGSLSSALPPLKWESWSEAVFARAKAEKRLVILDLEAVWCHWCHVMDKETYHDPRVLKILNAKFIPVKVDQDSRPDLSNRYEDYGWPATVIFNAQGEELVKRAGYISPSEMLVLLNQVVKNPSTANNVDTTISVNYSAKTRLDPVLSEELSKKHLAGYDKEKGGWGTYHKFLDGNSVSYCLALAHAGDRRSSAMAKQTLDAGLFLLDPAWGGVYQYSTNGDWKHPHFEKIMQMQADNLSAYALGSSYYHEPKYLRAATSIYNYLTNFLLSPEGSFYNSQDADLVAGKHSAGYFKLPDAERRKRGMPRIDKHIYARENGWAIRAIIGLYMAVAEPRYLETAKRAAQWIINNRSLSNGGFSHDAKDAAGPYLGDTLYMGSALLSLYAATGERYWLKKAEFAANFIANNFVKKATKDNTKADPDKNQMAGFLTSSINPSNISKHGLHYADPLLEENIAAARFFNLLYHYSGKQEYKDLAEIAMRYLSTPVIARKRKILVAGTLLANKELSSEPVHITVIASRNDKTARSLFLAALKYPVDYKRTEWWDPKEDSLANTEVEYPKLAVAAAFGCAGNRCSLPIFKSEELKGAIDRLYQIKQAR